MASAWAALCLAAAAAATPYADPQGRFAVSLPAGWERVAGSEAHGAVFRFQQGAVLINATVQIMPLGGPVTLDAFAARIGAAAEQEPGFRLLAHGRGTLAGQPMLSRRYVVFVNNERRLSKIVAQRMLVAGSDGFVVHAETIAEAYPTVAKDLEHFLGSLRLGAAPATAGSAAAAAALAASPPEQRRLAGTWSGASHRLALGAGGEATLDGVAGSYHVDHGVMVLELASGQQIATYRLRGDTLHLAGGPFADGQSFSRSR